MKQTIKYKGKRIVVDTKKKIRKGVCEICGREGKTHIHHWRYEFPLKEVRENPNLALLNTTEVCFTCHNFANAMRKLYVECPADIFINLHEEYEKNQGHKTKRKKYYEQL